MQNNFGKKHLDFFPSNSGDNDALFSFLGETSKVLCKWFSESGQLDPMPLNLNFSFSPPQENGLDQKKLIKEINQLVYNSFNPCHPGSLAHLDPPPLTLSIAGDLIAGALNNNLLANELSPSISLLEEEMCKWFAGKLGYGNNSGGIAASGGTLNNLNALVTARNILGLETDPDASFIISKEAHVSFEKCRKILGLKKENIITVDTNPYGIMDCIKLEEELDKNLKFGKKVFAIVATLGTTITGSIDPISDISKICKDRNIWLHIDGSIGGIFSMFNSNIKNYGDVSNSDSITINPQKVLGITKTSSLLIVKDVNTLKETFHTGLPYLDSDEMAINRGELGVQGSRPAEIIKLWLGLNYLGISGVEKILNDSIHKKELLQQNLNEDKFEIHAGPLHIITFVPKGMTRNESNKWTYDARKLLIKNEFMLSRPFYKNQYFLRAVLGNFNTEESHILTLSRILNNT